MPIGRVMKSALSKGKAMQNTAASLPQEERQPVERPTPMTTAEGRTAVRGKPMVRETQPIGRPKPVVQESAPTRGPRRSPLQAQLGLQALSNRVKPPSKPSGIAARIRRSLKPGFK